jgi:hypothetical protein
MTGNLICTLLACDLGEVFLRSEELLRDELWLGCGNSTTGCKDLLNFASTW